MRKKTDKLASPNAEWPPGDSEMGQFIRHFDWSTTPLGPINGWPLSLRFAVAAALDSPLPTIVLWGEALIQIYNDAYKPILGLRHPAAMGQPTHQCWPEAESISGPLFRRIFETGKGIHIEDQKYVFAEDGVKRTHYFTISFGPARDESGEVCGVQAVAIETTQRVLTERENQSLLRKTQFAAKQLQAMFEQAPNFMALMKGPDHVFELANPMALKLAEGRDLIGKPMREAIPETESQGFIKLLDEVYATGKAFLASGMPVILESMDGGPPTLLYVDFVYQPITNEDGEITGIFLLGSDVTEKMKATKGLAEAHRDILERMRVEKTLSQDKARAEVTLNSISDAVIGTDLSAKVNYLNKAAEALTGWAKEEARGQPITEVMRISDSVTHQRLPNPVELVLQKNETVELTAGMLLTRRDGSNLVIEDSAAPIQDDDGHIAGAVIVFNDITATQAMAQKMSHLAQHDFLTNLPNRVLLNDRIAQAIVQAKRHGTHLAVLFLDLDNFKHINDSLGHAVGDHLLQSVAQRLASCVRGSDTVSRQGGDEFVVLVTEDQHAENAALTAEKILGALAAPHSIGDHELHITTSIGISIYPEDGVDEDTLIKNADTAMYQAKEKGRNNYQFFESHMNVRAVERQVIETHLRLALERHEFVLHYQPKVNLLTGAVTGAEALLRWMHPERGLILPDRFVPIAEDCGLIVPIGRWVLREACKQAKQWQSLGLEQLTVSVNISALEFRRPDFASCVETILKETALAPHFLQLEITESVLMRDATSSTAVLQQLKKMGVELAVDDFGTGYSSLSYLQQFPIDVLKIDQSFVHDIDSSKGKDNGIIVSAVIAMGNKLKQRVVAEGVEEQGQLSFLKAQHCEEGQGYFFSRPLAAEEFTALLATDN